MIGVPFLLSTINLMAVKVLVNQIGQHIIAETKQVENKETKEVIAYWVSNPRLAAYSKDESGDLAVGFSPYCVLSDEAQFTIRAESIVSILEPRDDVTAEYEKTTGVSDTGASPAEEAPVVTESEPVEVDA